MRSVELKMRPEVIERLRLLGLRLGHERGIPVTWAQLAREGADLVLEKYGSSPAVKALKVEKVGECR